MSWIVATTTVKSPVATTPILIIRSMVTSPAANVVAEAAPAHGKTRPSSTLAMRIAIDAGLHPLCTAAGMKTLQFRKPVSIARVNKAAEASRTSRADGRVHSSNRLLDRPD
jgi:hypothetical protein